MDRVAGRIVEKPAGEWERDVTAEEFVPEHRIEWFKRYGGEGKDGELVWVKRGRGGFGFWGWVGWRFGRVGDWEVVV